MALVCLDCGHIFDECEVKHWVEPHGEPMSGCPLCNGAFEEAKHCKHCHGDFSEDALFDGWCEECLVDMITLDNFWLYLKDRQIVADFMFSNLWKSSVPENVSDELMNMMEQMYKALADYEKRFRKDGLMKLCEEFVLEDEYSKWDFAEWLNSAFKEVNK